LDKKNVIKEKWGKQSILELAKTLNISLSESLEIALDLRLHKKDTPNMGRTWTKEEEEFLTKYSNHLSVKEASNLLYRSHYATYQRIKKLGLEEMINKK
jgi:hypothetical protein